VRLVPMASRSRIEERGRAHDLFGPVNKMNILSGFDQGMVCFLDCLSQLAAFARQRDMAVAGKSEAEAFALTFPIEGDRVGGLSIRYGMSKDAKWTKALKCMLADLKLCLSWVVSSRDERGLR
jgi:beclin